ncbi:probable C-mannosyltransferase DPY19L1 [Protopterus annectens]|uniref:probable C-mannosyltransferase DPY19L1 n=1 Tax=Protopterus annectens TaxID=7888 RepID=UPI001CFB644C|nr:probable C-mannosyltransferase DPY19L1 [Protopterus annectens]
MPAKGRTKQPVTVEQHNVKLSIAVPTGYSIRLGTILFLACGVGYLHWYHISTLFEEDRHFSHLSTLEREMAFRTEMGLYYSYFKTIVEAPSLWNGLNEIMNDRLTEYPLVINTLKRFNVYPEVVLASCYRIFIKMTDFFNYRPKQCYSVHRGHGLSPVLSCEGLGDPACFYVSLIFILNGCMMSLFFIFGTYLSGSRLGGLVTVACFFFNHGECTRVMWTPPLRESFSYPFLILQMMLLISILRSQNADKKMLTALCAANIFFMLPWQFAQFVLLTQISCLFAAYVLGYIDSSLLQKILSSHMVSLLICFVLMFGNAMLLTSYYASSLVVIWTIISFKNIFVKFARSPIIIWIAEVIAWFAGTTIIKILISKILGAADDAHIGNLLKSKFTNYKDFDTLMYSCAVEFDFMLKETPLQYTTTLLLPVVIFIFCVVGIKTLLGMWYSGKTSLQATTVDGNKRQELLHNGEVVYLNFQLIAFAVMAILIMRLKLFLTPHMCLMASLVSSKQLFGRFIKKYQQQLAVLVLLTLMAIQGSANLQAQWSIKGEFSNLPQEELIEWVKAHTNKDAVFAGAMPTMASIKLSANRPIVNHPHYEDAGLRARTKIVYSMYSRKPVEEVKQGLLNLSVNYFILEDSWCTRRTRPGCSMPEIWDVEDPKHAGRTPLCTKLSKETRPHFITVFENDVYKVLKIVQHGHT